MGEGIQTKAPNATQIQNHGAVYITASGHVTSRDRIGLDKVEFSVGYPEYPLIELVLFLTE